MKTFVSIAVLFFSTTLLTAQDRYFYLTLDVTRPLANTSWVSDASARGARLGFRSFITDKISAGLDLGMNSYDEYFPRQTVETATGAVTTDYFHYIYSYSAAITGQYNFTVGDGEKFIPYAGIGLGAANQEYVKYYNFYTESDKSWGFLARPEAGIRLRLSERRGLGLMAAIHYDYTTNRMKTLDYKGFSALGFQIGLVFMDR